MELRLPYGSSEQHAVLTTGQSLGVLDIADVPALADPSASIRHALEHPIGLDRNFYQLVRPGETVAVVVSDAFRNTGSPLFLPVLMNGLNQAGVPDRDVIIVFATGTHRPPTPDEQVRIVGEPTYRRFTGRLFVHDPRDDAQLIYLGTTSRGTPVRLNRRVFERDRVIVTGACVLHYFGGYGGGRKSVLPGLAAIDTIAHNHAMNLDPVSDRLNPAVGIGILDGNPVAEDMLEGAKLAKVDCLLNTVLNRRGEIAGVFAGELEAAHRAAAAFAYDLFAVHLSTQADLVFASSAGTRNFVQTHKALFNAYQAMRPGGRIILLAPCPEGLGGDQFVQWLRLRDREAIIAGLRKQSEINGQTALSTVHKGPSTILVTELSDADAALLGARKASDLDAAVTQACAELREQGIAHPTFYVMPSAAYTVPFIDPSAA